MAVVVNWLQNNHPRKTMNYSHLSPSRLLLSMGTNSLVLKITLKYHGGNHKNRTNGYPSSKREPQTENPILTKTEIRNEQTQKRSLLSDQDPHIKLWRRRPPTRLKTISQKEILHEELQLTSCSKGQYPCFTNPRGTSHQRAVIQTKRG